MGKYLDIRQKFWAGEFRKALTYEEYLGRSETRHRAKWYKMAEQITLPGPKKETVRAFTRKMPVLVLSGVWCGDCVRQGPMLKRIASANPSIDLRFVERVDGAQLTDELRINGAMKVPVAVFLSEDHYEIGRFGDRLLTAYRRMAATQLGPACDTGLVAPPEDELQAEISEWVDIFERMHLILRLAPLLRERYED